jgi:hypothetical protein
LINIFHILSPQIIATDRFKFYFISIKMLKFPFFSLVAINFANVLTCTLGAELLAAKAESSTLAPAPAVLAHVAWLALALRGPGEE